MTKTRPRKGCTTTNRFCRISALRVRWLNVAMTHDRSGNAWPKLRNLTAPGNAPVVPALHHPHPLPFPRQHPHRHQLLDLPRNVLARRALEPAGDALHVDRPCGGLGGRVYAHHPLAGVGGPWRALGGHRGLGGGLVGDRSRSPRTYCDRLPACLDFLALLGRCPSRLGGTLNSAHRPVVPTGVGP